jgi:hypothetical protein
MELLAALVVAGVRIGEAVDDLDCPLGVPELHILIDALAGNVLLAFPLAGRRDIMAGLLLLLLAELLHRLLDLSAVLDTVAEG